MCIVSDPGTRLAAAAAAAVASMALLALLVAAPAASQSAEPPNPLTTVKALKCRFPAATTAVSRSRTRLPP